MTDLQNQIEEIRTSLTSFESDPTEFGLRAILDNVIDLANCTTDLETTKKTSAAYVREANAEIEYSKSNFQKRRTGVACGYLRCAIFALFFATRATVKKELQKQEGEAV